jgi:hypothetical protein
LATQPTSNWGAVVASGVECVRMGRLFLSTDNPEQQPTSSTTSSSREHKDAVRFIIYCLIVKEISSYSVVQPLRTCKLQGMGDVRFAALKKISIPYRYNY